MAQKTLLKGRVLSFTGSPFDGEPTEATRLDEAVVIEHGRIAEVGTADALKKPILTQSRRITERA